MRGCGNIEIWSLSESNLNIVTLGVGVYMHVWRQLFRQAGRGRRVGGSVGRHSCMQVGRYVDRQAARHVGR